MYKIKVLDKISSEGLKLFPADQYQVGTDVDNPDAWLVRSRNLHEMEIPDSLKAIARAGAGVNNIPIEKCQEQGIMVFNTPGANANGVKELVLMALIMASRHIYQGISWTKSLMGQDEPVTKLVEKGKSQYKGPEIVGKRLGIIGLGAIGVMVANDAEALGMQVSGYDPFLSVKHALGLSRRVRRSESLDTILAESDYITLHVPLNDDTKNLIDAEKFAKMKKGVCLLNFARGGLVDVDDLKKAIDEGIVSTFVTDFPEDKLVEMDNVICVPHLGASTPESEENCAVMAVNQTHDFLENGNIVNSVTLPDCVLSRSCDTRITITNRNVPNMIGQISAVLAKENINISVMLNKSRGDYAYNLIGIDDQIEESVVDELRKIDGVIRVRLLCRK
jgi:D-3-phosphoglycerate dehydrogenase